MKILALKVILFFVIIEFIARLLIPSDGWYRHLCNKAPDEPIKHIFIGSSRVAFSINPFIFTQSVEPVDSKSLSVNMGKGYSTLMEHYLGLKKFAESSPGKLNGVVVFLEAPGGTAGMETWEDNWLHPDFPELLASTIDFSDLGAFWLKSSSDLKSKLIVTTNMLSQASQLLGRWQTVISPENYADTDISNLTIGYHSLGSEIRTDEPGISNSRNLAIRLADEAIKNQAMVYIPWERTVIKSLNDEILSYGGRLVLFFMPLSSVQEKLYSTEIGKKNKHEALSLLHKAKIPIIHVDFKTTDDDFPDLWHLKGSRTMEYTQSVAQAYLSSLTPNDCHRGNRFIQITSVTGAHERESDKNSWWHWVEHDVSFKLEPMFVSTNATRTKLRFEYGTLGDQTLTIHLICRDGQTRKMTIRSGGFPIATYERVIDLMPQNVVTLNIETDGRPSRLGAQDGRMASFMVRNISIIGLEP